jgi:hypothetical protein
MTTKKQGTRLSFDWQPTGKALMHAQALGLQPHQIQWVRNQFVRYFTGEDAARPVKKDWDRAFMNWVERDAHKARRVRKEDIAEAHREQTNPNLLWHLRMKGWLERKFWPAMAGPTPNEKGCAVPKEVLREFGLA